MPKAIPPTVAQIGQTVVYTVDEDDERLVELIKLEGTRAEFRMLGSDFKFTSNVNRLRQLYPGEQI